MPQAFLTHEQFSRAPKKWDVTRRTARGVMVELDRVSMADVTTAVAPAALPDFTTRTLDALARVPWPHRGSLLWMLLRNHQKPSPALIDAVRKLVPSGTCKCRDHMTGYLEANPPDYGDGWRRWVYDFQQAVNKGRGVQGIAWEEAERRHALADRAGAVWVISMEHTPERLDAFYRRLPRDWPLALPQWFVGLNGDKIPKPTGWRDFDTNTGTIGCRASWLAVLDQLIADGVDKPAIVFEDDAQLTADAVGRIGPTLDALPDGWELLYLGGEHNSPPKPFAPGLVRVNRTGRTHAMVIRPRYFVPLRDFWREYLSHVDWGLREIGPSRQFYAAEPFFAIQGLNYSTLRNQLEQPRGFDVRVQMPPGRTATLFFHRGDVGDILAAMPTMRAASREAGGGELLVCPADFTRQKMSPAIVDGLRPLLEAQPYIKSVRYSEEQEGEPLDAWRWRQYPTIYSLADRTLDLLDWSHEERNTPWLTVEPNPVARVVFARSPRYRNARFPWKKIVEKYGKEAVFVGHKDEHADFETQFGPIPWVETPDHLALARVLAGAEIVVVNQTSTLWVSMGLGRTTIVEQDPNAHVQNCQHALPHLHYPADERSKLPELPAVESFGQYGEDAWVRRNVVLPSKGVFVDVGAHDGKTGSNSLLFERMGWSGLCVEPDVRQAASLRRHRDCDLAFCAAASVPAMAVPFHRHPIDGWAGLLRTEGEVVNVPAMRLDTLVAVYGLDHVDVLSIDTEGTELDVWVSLGDVARPTVVIMEHDTAGMPDRSADLLATFEAEGYRMAHKTAGNFVFVRQPLA